MEPGKIMYYNWNRMAVLDKQRHQTTDEINERKMRMQFQNRFACVKNDSDAIEFAYNMVEPTLITDVIRSVDNLMKEHITK